MPATLDLVQAISPVAAFASAAVFHMGLTRETFDRADAVRSRKLACVESLRTGHVDAVCDIPDGELQILPEQDSPPTLEERGQFDSGRRRQAEYVVDALWEDALH